MLAAREQLQLKHDRVIDITSFKSLTETNAINEKITYGQLLNKISKPTFTNIKGDAGGFIGGYVHNNRNKDNVKSRSLITIDVDEVQQGLDMWESIEGFTNFAVAMYSTHSHTKENPRYRVIIPLLNDIAPEQYQEVTQYLVGILQIGIDEGSFQYERHMHYPTCSNHNTFEFHYQDLPFFDARFIVKQHESIETFRSSKKTDPRTKQNWIGAWVNVYSITDVIETFLSDVYEPLRGDRYTYKHGSTKGGLVVYDNDTHAQSNHSTDPISGKNVNSFDLYRLHKFGKMDKGVYEKITDMPSYKAMVYHCQQDEKVNAYYEEKINVELKVSGKGETIEVEASQFFNENNTFLHHKFACYLAENWNIISLDERLHIYDNGKYVADDTYIKRLIVTILPSLTVSKVREVMERLKLVVPVKQHSEPRYIGVKNGVYDLQNKKLLDHSPDFVITNQINADYIPLATCRDIDHMLELISNNDIEVMQLIKEMIGYTFYRKNSLEKAFLFKGEGGNGKSTLFSAINALLGEENIAGLSLSDLSERFNTGMLNGKLANVGDDIPYTSIKDTSNFKKLTTGNLIKGEFKGETPFYFRSFAKLIFATNKMPRLYDNSQGLKDRLVIIPLNARIRGSKNQDIFFEDKITTNEARSYLLNVGIAALNDLLAKGEFITPNVVKLELEEFEITNNPVAEWLNEYYEDGKDIHYLPVASAYGDYEHFCLQNNYKFPLSKKALTIELSQHGYDSDRKFLNGKQIRVYFKTEETFQKDA